MTTPPNATEEDDLDADETSDEEKASWSCWAMVVKALNPILWV